MLLEIGKHFEGLLDQKHQLNFIFFFYNNLMHILVMLQKPQASSNVSRHSIFNYANRSASIYIYIGGDIEFAPEKKIFPNSKYLY